MSEYRITTQEFGNYHHINTFTPEPPDHKSGWEAVNISIQYDNGVQVFVLWRRDTEAT